MIYKETTTHPLCVVCGKPMYLNLHHCDKWDSEVIEYISSGRQWNAAINTMIHKLDLGYKDYVWYKHLRKELESLRK